MNNRHLAARHLAPMGSDGYRPESLRRYSPPPRRRSSPRAESAAAAPLTAATETEAIGKTYTRKNEEVVY